ncbi:MAG: hypothetical protein LBC83_01785 [Oscillospiraceae bacterium]|nr:hypothetical protein [Oscillospiraceae bacterium]
MDKRESLTLSQAARRFAKQVKITVAVLTAVLIALLVGATVGGKLIGDTLTQWTGKNRWSWTASHPYAQYDFDA